MHLTTADGKRYVMEKFNQARGAATAHLVMTGVVYPASLEWKDCTLSLGDHTITDVKCGITDILIENALRDESLAITTYGVVLTWNMRS
jgi:hypothetical protein